MMTSVVVGNRVVTKSEVTVVGDGRMTDFVTVDPESVTVVGMRAEVRT